MYAVVLCSYSEVGCSAKSRIVVLGSTGRPNSFPLAFLRVYYRCVFRLVDDWKL
jgi:hypothetical protein